MELLFSIVKFGIFFSSLVFSTFAHANDSTDQIEDCGHGWVPFNGSCFRITRPVGIYREGIIKDYEGGPGKYVIITVARSSCLEIGAELASIHSSQEDAFVRELILTNGSHGFYLIGLIIDRPQVLYGIDDTVLDVFWADGSPVDYGNPMTVTTRGVAPWKVVGAGDQPPQCRGLTPYMWEYWERKRGEPEPNNAMGFESVVVMDMANNTKQYQGWAEISADRPSAGAVCRKDIVPKPKHPLASRSSPRLTYPIIAILPLIGQSYVLWLILTKSPIAMKNYRIYLCANVISDMAGVIVIGLLINPDNWLPHALGANVNGLAQYTGAYGGMYSFFLAFFAFVCQGFSQLFALFHRYCAIMKIDHPKLGDFIDGRYPFLNWTQLIVALFTATAAAYGMANSIEGPKLVPGMLWTTDGTAILWGTDALHHGQPLIMFMPSKILYPIVVAFTLFTIFLLISLYFAQKLIRYLRERRQKFSEKLYSMHLQLVISLKIQLLLPCLFVGIPLMPLVVMLAIGLVTQNPGIAPGSGACQLGIALFELFAPANTLVLLLSISPYRRHLAMLFKKAKMVVLRKSHPDTEVAQQHHLHIQQSTVMPSEVWQKMFEKAERQGCTQ